MPPNETLTRASQDASHEKVGPRSSLIGTSEQLFDDQLQASPSKSDEAQVHHLTPQGPTSPSQMVDNHKEVLATTATMEARLDRLIDDLDDSNVHAERRNELLQARDGIRAYKVLAEDTLHGLEKAAIREAQPPHQKILEMESAAGPVTYSHDSNVTDWLGKID